MNVTVKDREILREMAKRQRELSQSPIMKSRIEDWKALNNFKMKRPMILLEMDTFEHEIIPRRLICESAEARRIEAQILRRTLPHELFDDDYIVPEYFPLEWKTYFNLFGQETKRHYATTQDSNNVGHTFEHVIDDLEDDWEKLAKSTWGVDRKGTEKEKVFLEELFGDILPVKMIMNCLYSVPTQKIVHIMGMETMLVAMIDSPELFETMMNRAAEDTVEYFKWLENEELILPTVNDERLGQGTYCYTEELPASLQADGRLTSKDVWGFMDSQETVGISPDMYGEMIFPCYQKIASQFGLLSYGCCEPVHPIWEKYLSKMENMRKISISPWCDQNYMGEALKGKNIVFQRKPSPNYLGVNESFDEAELRKHIMETVQAAKDCTFEITQRDVYTIHNNIQKAKRYIEIIRECTQ